MSNIYIQEPATRGKVVLETTVGDIEIELFSKECPLACRNFLQLCMDGYYDGTVFHRVVKDFIVQGGDPTGTGEGGESATGELFADEFHTRLRFNRRGLVGMVNQGPNTNGSQFFFTLGSTPELDKKNTLFGKIIGNTLFNMLKLGEGEIEGETPVHKHKIIKTEIISNPFDNMVARPRAKPEVADNREANKKAKDVVYARAVKNYGLLSFGNEAEEEEEEITKVSMTFKQKGTGKSAHDLTNDATLSKSTVRLDEDDDEQSDEELPVEKKAVKEKTDEDYDREELDRVRKKLTEKKFAQQSKKNPVKLDADDDEDDEEMASKNKGENVKLEIERLKKELKKSKKSSTSAQPSVDNGSEQVEAEPAPMVSSAASTTALMDELMAGTRRNVKKNNSNSNSRESQTLDLLAKFRVKFNAAKEKPANETANEVKDEEVADEVKDEFFNHRFVSEQLLDTTQDIYTNADLLAVYDPRNPMTKRRRDESSALLREKKHKGH